MRTRLLVCMAVVVAAGCVPSLHSIVTDKTLTYDPALAGRYQADETVWTITGDPNEKSYAIVIKEKEDKQSLLKAKLVDVQGVRFLDFYPSDDARLNTGDWFNAHILPVHVFWKLDKTEAGYTLAGLNPDNLKTLLADNPGVVKHEVVEGRVVLTDSAENLQKFLLDALKIEKVFGDAMELKHVKE